MHFVCASMYTHWSLLSVLLACLGAVLQGVAGTGDGYVFLSREQESFVAYQTGSSMNWRPRAEGSLHLKFRTPYKDSLLAFAEGPTGRFQIWLEEGKLRIEYFNGTSVLEITMGRRLNTGATIDLTIYKYPASVLTILHDGVNSAVVEDAAHDLVWDLDSYFYVGGVRVTLKGKVKSPAKFIGCIYNVGLSNISAVNIETASPAAQSGVEIGNCTSYDACEVSNECADKKYCVNLWNDTACNCSTAPMDGPTCNEYGENANRADTTVI